MICYIGNKQKKKIYVFLKTWENHKFREDHGGVEAHGQDKEAQDHGAAIGVIFCLKMVCISILEELFCVGSSYGGMKAFPYKSNFIKGIAIP